jgi:2-dehydro-3-deoxygluconokinase
MFMMNKKKVVAFGEVLGSMRPVGYASFGDTNDVLIMAGGSEVNVLGKVGGLALGIQTQFVTKMKDDLIGRLLRSDIQKYKVGMDYVVWTDRDRNGFCFVEQGLGPITAEGQYDRTHSAFANARPEDFGFSVLEGADAFFISGITPALSQNCLENSMVVLETAKRYRVPVFFDVNFRSKLWTPQQAFDAFMGMVKKEYITCLITTETDARVVFGIDRGFNDDKPMDEILDCCRNILKSLEEKFEGKVPILVMTVRKRITNERGEWTTISFIEGKEFVVGEMFDYIVLDRYGAGDSCSAGIIGGYLGITPNGIIEKTLTLEERIQYGLNLGNRMSVVAQKTVSDIGPQWTAKEYYMRVGKSKEIAR